MNELLTVKDAAEYLTISRSQLYLLIQQKKIPHVRLSERRIVIRLKDLLEWLEKKTVLDTQ
jgi:excisionase family DNA binding protein